MLTTKSGEVWDEVFRTGEHVNAAGVKRSFSEADLDHIAAGYSPAKHEVPLVIGHPAANAPAYGWVESLKRVGSSLMAKYRQVQPEFSDWVKRGLYRKKSISLYPDNTLRHVGYLGAQPPAIKGLADVAFEEAPDAQTFEFAETNPGAVRRLLQGVRDFFIEKFGLESADKVLPSWDIDNIEVDTSTKSFAEGEPPMSREKELEDNLSEETRKNQTLTTQFSEAQTKLSAAETRATAAEAKVVTLEKSAADGALAQRKAENKSFCEGLVRDGRMRPADVANSLAFMDSLSAAGEIEFAEADKTSKKPALDAFKAHLAAQPKLVEFGEHKAGAGVAAGSAADKLEQATRKLMGEKKDLSYAMAFTEAQAANPELAQEYVLEIRK